MTILNVYKKDGQMSNDIGLLLDEMYLQKFERYLWGELVGFDENGELCKGIYDSMTERFHPTCDRVISRNNN